MDKLERKSLVSGGRNGIEVANLSRDSSFRWKDQKGEGHPPISPVRNQRREAPRRISSQPQWRQVAWTTPPISTFELLIAEWRPFSHPAALILTCVASNEAIETGWSGMRGILPLEWRAVAFEPLSCPNISTLKRRTKLF